MMPVTQGKPAKSWVPVRIKNVRLTKGGGTRESNQPVKLNDALNAVSQREGLFTRTHTKGNAKS